MGGFAARKVEQVVSNVEVVIAIELLASCQALEFFRPLQTTEPLERVYELVRSEVRKRCARAQAVSLYHRPSPAHSRIVGTVHLSEPVLRPRPPLSPQVSPWDKDRHMSPDIDAVTRMVRDGRLLEAAFPGYADAD